MKYYRLEIDCKPDKIIFNSISEILGVEPEPFKPSKMFPIETYDDWTYEVTENEDDDYFDFINDFLDIIEPNLDKLAALGVSTNNILIWKLYEYNEQCAMSFNPHEMKRMGDLGIALNIDCWES